MRRTGGATWIAGLRAAAASPRGRLALRALRTSVFVLAIGFVALTVWTHRDTAGDVLSALDDVHGGWLAVAIAAEIASLLAFARLVRHVLLLGDVDAPILSLLRAVVSGVALTYALPGGPALSLANWYQALRTRGADRTLSMRVLVVTTIVGLATLVLLAVIGIGIAGDLGPAGDWRASILIAVGALVALAALVGRRAASWLRRRLAGRAARWHESARLGPRARASDRVAVIGLSALNWLLDCMCLTASLMAVGADVPWQAVLGAYAIGMLVANVPVLPGGGGTVEATIALGLTATGDLTAVTLAGVVLFRLINCWALIPIGLGALVLGPGRLRTARCPRLRFGT